MSSRLKQTGAGIGRRSPKTGQSNYFLGYKKHTLSGFVECQGSVEAVPLYSLVRSAAKADVEMLKPLLNYTMRQLAHVFAVQFVVGDKGYISADRARLLRQKWKIALVVAPKSDMTPPKGTDPDGCPLCPMGRRLQWDDYDADDEVLLYRAANGACARCARTLICPKRFEFPASSHDTFWGMVPFHSKLSRQLLRYYRPRVEPGFHTSKNLSGLSQFHINSISLAQQLCTMSDVLQCLKILARKRAARVLSSMNTPLITKTQPELWD